jgi:hypothetical protein
LFARQVLIVEGPSETGFLPVAFRHLSHGKPYDNPYHLGLEVMDGDSRDESLKHAKILRGYGRRCHLLRDYDINGGHPHDDIATLSSRFNGAVDFVTCWPNKRLFDFADGCDLETILAANVIPTVLFEAIKNAYQDAGHAFLEDNWIAACKQICDQSLVEAFPAVCRVNLNEIEIEHVGDERTQRAFLFALLHGPHSCKSAKDMRLIAPVLAEHNAFPSVIDALRQKVLRSMLRPQEIDHAQPYLHVES